MARIDLEKLWRLQGTFYDIFTPEQKKTWEALWESYGDLASDLWHLVFQTDREKSLFSANYATKRHNTRVLLSNRRDSTFVALNLARTFISSTRQYQIVGTISEGERIPARVIPSQGLVWLGEEVIPYASATFDLREDNSIRKVVFTLVDAPLRSFTDETRFGDVFPGTGLRTNRWLISGTAPTVNNRLIIALEPPAPPAAELTHLVQIAPGDFEVEVTFEVQSSGVIADALADKTFEVLVSTGGHQAGIGYLDNTHQIQGQRLLPVPDPGIAVSIPPEVVTQLIADDGAFIPIRFFISREGSNLSLFALFSTSRDPVLVHQIDNFGTGITSIRLRVTNTSVLAANFVVRDLLLKFGEVPNFPRLHPTLFSSSSFPFVFSVDQNIVELENLRDEPTLRDKVVSVSPIPIVGATTIQVSGVDEVLVAGAIPAVGTFILRGQTILYDKATITGGIAKLRLRRSLDAYDLAEVGTSLNLTLRTRTYASDDFSLGNKLLTFKELPGQGEVWALDSRIDVGSLQNRYGSLVGLTSTRADIFYLNRVQAAWAARMRGPTVQNIESVVAAFAGLPIARVSGVVTEILEERDFLGRIVKSRCFIGTIPHELEASLIPRINWVVRVGQQVELLEPLTNGFEVVDYVLDPNWLTRLGIAADTPEKFNTFGVFVDSQALSRHTTLTELYDFLTRNRFLPKKLRLQVGLLDDAILTPHVGVVAEDIPIDCLDLTFPEEPSAYERFGLGDITVVDPESIATFVVTNPEQPRARFINPDLGKDIIIDGVGPNAGRFRIRAVLSPSSIQFWNPRAALEAGLGWQAGEEPPPTLGVPLGRGGAFLGRIARLGRSGVWRRISMAPGVVLGHDPQQGPVSIDLTTPNEVHGRGGVGEVTGVAAGIATFAVLPGTPNQRFVSSDVGKDIAISTVGPNQGFFRISSFIDQNTVEYENVAAAPAIGLDFRVIDPPRGWQQIIETVDDLAGMPVLKHRRIRFTAEDYLDEWRAVDQELDPVLLDDGSTIFLGFSYFGTDIGLLNNINVTFTRRAAVRLLNEAFASPCGPRVTRQPSEITVTEELLSVDIDI